MGLDFSAMYNNEIKLKNTPSSSVDGQKSCLKENLKTFNAIQKLQSQQFKSNGLTIPETKQLVQLLKSIKHHNLMSVGEHVNEFK